MIFYVAKLNRTVYLSPEVEQRLRENARRVAHEVLRQIERKKFFRRLGFPKDLIERLTRINHAPATATVTA